VIKKGHFKLIMFG